tara:strand:+ start:42 stop:797 length:756 start_codon:yes stop_codon:yes gene_type:complete
MTAKPRLLKSKKPASKISRKAITSPSDYEEKIKDAYKKLRKSYKEIKDSYVEMILRFALLAEFRDESTGTHLVRIADYSTEIAKGLTLNSKEIYYLRYASLMHDIGKIIIPDSILKKKGGLTPAERQIIKKHPALGADIFKDSSSPLLKYALVISLTHHERYDGTGYPQGLRGESIPLFGRIVALADVFDALTTKRSYKPAYTFKEAIDIIKADSKKHFDPAIVEIFLKRKSKIRKIWQATKEIDSIIKKL